MHHVIYDDAPYQNPRSTHGPNQPVETVFILGMFPKENQ